MIILFRIIIRKLEIILKDKTVNVSNSNWILETCNSAYFFGINEDGYLINSFWGKRKDKKTDYPLPVLKAGWASFDSSANVLPEEYPVYGRAFHHEPCLKITFADGVRDLVLKYETDWSSQNEIAIQLCDTYYPIQVILHYRAHADYDLIERWVEVINKGQESLTVERIFSAQWHFPDQQQCY